MNFAGRKIFAKRKKKQIALLALGLVAKWVVL